MYRRRRPQREKIFFKSWQYIGHRTQVANPGDFITGTVVDQPVFVLRDRAGELDPARPVVTYCAGGYRSSIAASLLRASGFADVSDLIGGYQAWQARPDRQ